MNISEIQKAIETGKTVYWQNHAYTVVKGKWGLDETLFIEGPNGHRVCCESNGQLINSNPSDFFTL